MSDEVKKQIKDAMKEDAKRIGDHPTRIGDDFYEFHTFTAVNPIIVNISTIMIIGVVDGITTLTFNVQEHNGPCIIEVRESYEAIRTILSRRYK